jgi:hypothetical protein
MTFVNTLDIVKFCWLAPVVFYLSLLERVFHVKILCLRAVISSRSSLLPIAFYNRDEVAKQSCFAACTHLTSDKTHVYMDYHVWAVFKMKREIKLTSVPLLLEPLFI